MILRHKGFKEIEGKASYDTALKDMAVEISVGISQRKAYDMSSLLSKYGEFLVVKEIKDEG